MSLIDVTREAVLAAIARYDELGQDEFLARYGFDRARAYLLVHDGKYYDSKAIVGVAHGFMPGGQPLSAGDFSGGEATVGRLLRRLGFAVQFGDLTTARLTRLLTSLNVHYSNGLPALYSRSPSCRRSAAPCVASLDSSPGRKRRRRPRPWWSATVAPARRRGSTTR